MHALTCPVGPHAAHVHVLRVRARVVGAHVGRALRHIHVELRALHVAAPDGGGVGGTGGVAGGDAPRVGVNDEAHHLADDWRVSLRPALSTDQSPALSRDEGC